MTFDYMFNPRSIAVVGASNDAHNAATNMFLDSIMAFGYKGKLYPVNPKEKEVRGLKAYPSVRDIPGPVDHVISAIPATMILQLLDDCKAKDVKTLHLYTAGFAETGIDDRGDMQQKLVEAARGSGVRILGPNCMGIYCPSSGVTFCPDFPREPGSIGFLSQSGSYSLLGVRAAGARGLRFSKMVSYGNASDIDECDLIEYLGNDAETKIIAAYIEGTKDGHRLRRVLTEAAARKPVIIIKKGGTEAGKRGAGSHTGSMTGDDKVWDAVIRQTGAIRAEDFEDMIDLLTTFQFFPLPKSKKAVLLGVGGGPSVRSADDCERAGLILSPIPDDMVAELRKTAPVAGSMVRNPVDIGTYRINWAPVIETLARWPENDMFIWQIAPDMEPFAEDGFLRQYCIDQRAKFLGEFLKSNKPLAVIVHMVERPAALNILNLTRELCVKNKVAFYTSVYSAARAVSKFIDWHDRRGT